LMAQPFLGSSMTKHETSRDRLFSVMRAMQSNLGRGFSYLLSCQCRHPQVQMRRGCSSSEQRQAAVSFGMSCASIAYSNDTVRDGVLTIQHASVHSVDVIDAAASGVFFNDAEAHVADGRL
jgi:hypothetical protein